MSARPQASGQKPKHKYPRADPQLPHDLMRVLKEDKTCPSYRSVVFTPEFNVVRHLMVAGEEFPEMIIKPEFVRGINRTIGPLPGAVSLTRTSTWLHLAATTGDIPLFYEILRLGCHLEVVDDLGRTPLYAGCDRLSSLVLNGKLRPFPSADSARLRIDVKRIEKVCILLVEQHAALDSIVNGKTLLHMACAAAAWDLIKVLLLHGADFAPTSLPRDQYCISLLKTSAEKQRFKALAQVPNDRPLRPCPCWSGESLSRCHARGDRAYPDHFVCRCNSRKVYEKCCKKKGVPWVEKWDPEEMWIQPSRVVSVKNPSEAFQQQLNMVVSLNESVHDGTSLFTAKYVSAALAQYTAHMMDDLVRLKHVDPGFAYAAKKVDFIPRPWNLPKVEQRKRVEEWNGSVDEYIMSDLDGRTREEIENACKIGPAGGPLYRVCENEVCREVEGREPLSGGPLIKLLVCSGCKKALYCTKECQRAAWSQHKPICQSGEAEDQYLPSQLSIREELQTTDPPRSSRGLKIA